ncbi:AGK_G0009650.mRNA.1.CDS.1 [Saccharomyces cerevisiae]|nr:AGK_G0009650.mRNA.1.CDS.1 [Saccharomyces cerevisiae]CAI6556898.1 AGK_G0009650.mRNA.1.CDS.1 [Saccharomyces cerevisiae]
MSSPSKPTSPFVDDIEHESGSASNGLSSMSPFDDSFQFEKPSSAHGNIEVAKTGGSVLKRQSKPMKDISTPDLSKVTFDGIDDYSDDNDINDDDELNGKKTEIHEHENEVDDDLHSFQATPMPNTGGFEDVELDNNEGSNNDSQADHKLKRVRFGTRRNKSGRIDINRSKTLKWAKKNFHNAIDEFSTKEDSLENSALQNRSDELRTVYYNLPLPEDMLDEDGLPLAVYPRNKIRTTKYTPLTFFPKNILFQFHNFANIYFLILLILGAFQIFGVTNPGFASVPLIVIVIITAIKDGIEDSRRTVLDLEVNNTRTHILSGVKNENVAVDNVSLWRRFKKANTRALIKIFEYFSENLTAAGREKKLQKKREELRRKRNSRSFGPRGSLDSIGSYRMSADFGRPSLDYENLNQTMSQANRYNDGENLVDRTLPPNPECRFAKDYWKNVKVGDIVRVHNNDEIPADMILLSTSDVDGACYVETKNLDGETNLKVRQSLKCSKIIKSSRDITRTKFWVESEGPHANLYSYQGNFKWQDTQNGNIRNEPVNINNLLLRGCTLRNTKWAMGMVIFTGDDTKIMINAGVTPTKKSRISRELNFSVILNFVLLFILCFTAGIVNGVYYKQKPRSRDYFEFGTIGGSASTNGFVSFWVAVILYQSLVPISLYISVEIIKTAQAIFIYTDVLLYNAKLDYPCTPKSWNISDDLGQIEYIFSDKTGTLTQNVMEFKKCTINGVSYGRAYTEALAGLRKRQGVDVESEGRREKEEIAKDRETMIDELRSRSDNTQFCPEDLTFVSKEIVEDLKGSSGDHQQKCCEHFLLALALCHSVLVEPNKDDPKKLDIKAQSPDESALVSTARQLGYSFVGSSKSGLIVEIQGVQKEFQVLNVLEFNSSRKRMSCIIKIPGSTPNDEPKALLICKGADSVIYSRLDRTQNDATLLEKTALHLEEYATEGLRTLCLAQRELTWSEYERWVKTYDVAAASVTNREEELDKVTDVIERELILLGGTAIEDRLQDGVPDSIALLAEAGIKLWVLTGDKVETAINIGFSCNVLNNDMELLVVKASGEDVEEFGSDPIQVVNNLVTKYLREKFGMSGSEEELKEAKREHGLPQGNFAVIIDGDALKVALNGEEMRRKFLLLCKNCKAVLCCRVSPAQKAAVVKLVKKTLDVMTLAIGDGSNDVAMIQSADVGVGIAGEEGRQAVMCSDYAIGQFRYVTRLVLVHGKWCYKRLAEMIPQFFYKNVIFTLSLFWYGIYNNFDGSYLFEYTYLTFYNLAFTSVPVILLAVLDQDVSDTVSMLVPQLYRVGILRKEWNQTKFLWYMLDGVYQSVICFFFPYLAYHKNMVVTENGLGLDHRYFVGVFVTAIAVTSCNFYVFMEQYRWDWFCGLFICLSLAVFYGWTGIWTSSSSSNEFYKGAARVFAQPAYWAVLFVGVLFCLLPRFTIDCIRKIFYPKDIEIVREMWLRGDFDLYPQGYDPTDPSRPRINEIRPLTDFKEPISLDTHFDGVSHSQETIVTEEIPMSILNGEQGSRKGYRVSTTLERRDQLSPVTTTNNLPRRSMASARGNKLRTSLDRTREEMLANHQLDTRYSVERARASLDLPGINHAETLLSQRSRDR